MHYKYENIDRSSVSFCKSLAYVREEGIIWMRSSVKLRNDSPSLDFKTAVQDFLNFSQVECVITFSICWPSILTCSSIGPFFNLLTQFEVLLGVIRIVRSLGGGRVCTKAFDARLQICFEYCF